MSAPTTVVIVDDSADVRYLLACALQDDGRFTVVGEADSPAVAAELVQDTRPALVIVDLDLGTRETGTSLIRTIRDDGHTGTVAMVTSSSNESAHGHAIDAGADVVIEKKQMGQPMLDELAAAVAVQTML